MWYVFKMSFPQKFPNHKTLEGPETTEVVLENLYPNTIYHVWVAAKSRRGEGAATPKLAVRTEQYGKSYSSRLFFARRKNFLFIAKTFPNFRQEVQIRRDIPLEFKHFHESGG